MRKAIQLPTRTRCAHRRASASPGLRRSVRSSSTLPYRSRGSRSTRSSYFASASAGPLRAQSQPLPAPVILIVDLQQILQDAKAAKAVQAVINQEFTSYTKEVAQQEDELQKSRAELERQRTILAPDAFN